jgi:hypothetical protein
MISNFARSFVKGGVQQDLDVRSHIVRKSVPRGIISKPPTIGGTSGRGLKE